MESTSFLFVEEDHNFDVHRWGGEGTVQSGEVTRHYMGGKPSSEGQICDLKKKS